MLIEVIPDSLSPSKRHSLSELTKLPKLRTAESKVSHQELTNLPVYTMIRNPILTFTIYS